MFRKVLIANRGVIACRIIRTLRKLDVSSIAVYSEADRHSLHVAQAETAVLLGPPPAAESYLNQEAILKAAQDTGAQAVHPGYGFLSESADFAQACERAGIVFLGPSPRQIRALGLKHRAREIAVREGVPLLPGTGLLPDLAHALQEAELCSYPVILKSTAGGGGIGMRICRTACIQSVRATASGAIFSATTEPTSREPQRSWTPTARIRMPTASGLRSPARNRAASAPFASSTPPVITRLSSIRTTAPTTRCGSSASTASPGRTR